MACRPGRALALRALLGSTANEADLQSTGPPYFIREADIAAWLAATLRADVLPLGAALGLERLRGVDDLDFYQELCFDDTRGRQLYLMWRPQTPAPAEAVVYLEGDGRDWSDSLTDVVTVLGLRPDAITWRRSAI